MDKFLIFIDAADDAAMYPMSRFLGMTVAADATILVKFSSSIGSFGTDGAAADIVTLTVTADSELKVFKALAKRIADIGNYNADNHLVVCDDVNSVFAHADILSCTIAIDS
jgi:hypothetical protein